MSTTEPATTVGAPANDVVVIHRGTIDRVLVALGLLTAVVLAVAGGLLLWGKSFSNDYVADELGAQKISFPTEADLKAEGRDDLVTWAGQSVTTGDQAEAYASYIDGHLKGIAGGKVFSEMHEPQVAAEKALADAKAANKTEAELAPLQGELNKINGQRAALFQGETLRGLLLSTFAWSMIAKIAGIAAIVAFIAAVLMLILVVLGVVHMNKAKAAVRRS